MKIDKRFRIPLTGKYNKSIFYCPHCQPDPNRWTKYTQGRVEDVALNTIGFADTPHGLMQIIECQQCFEKYYYHAGESAYSLFVMYVNQGKHKHFESLGDTAEIPTKLKTPGGITGV